MKNIDDISDYNYKNEKTWIFSHLTKYKLLFGLFVLSSILVAFFSVKLSDCTGRAFDIILGKDSNLGNFKSNIYLMGAVTFLVLVFKLTNYLFIELMASRMERDSRKEIYYVLLKKNQTFLGEKKTGEIMANANSDVQLLNGMVNPGISNIINTMINQIFSLFFIARINYKLLIVPVLYEIVFLIYLPHFSKKIYPVIKDSINSFHNISAKLNEVLSGIMVVQSCAQEAEERKMFWKQLENDCELNVRKTKTQAMFLPLLFFGLTVALSFVHSIYLFNHIFINIGDVVYYISLITLMNAHSSTYVDCVVHMENGLSAARSIIKFISFGTGEEENGGDIISGIKGAVEFENVSLSYNDNLILDNISFSVNPGQVVAIVGQTGSGKSTLCKLINRIYTPTSGKIKIDGIDISNWEINNLRSQIAVVEQEVELFSKSIKENICFGKKNIVNDRLINEVADIVCADKFISNTESGYDTQLSDQGVTLSGGERQRLALARAVIVDSNILVLDDSTSAIDSSTANDIYESLRDKIFKGKTVFIITNNLSEIQKADKIIMLKKGKMLSYGSHDELFEKCSDYRSLFTETKYARR